MTDHSSQVVVITGSSSGIGQAIARRLANSGHKVYGLSRTIDTESLFHALSVDVTDETQVKKAIQEIISKEKTIDVLINNAGRGMVGAIEDASTEEIESLMKLNFIAPQLLIKSVLPYFRAQNSGKIINISSIASEMGLPFRGMYSASKSALDKINEALRYEVEGFGVQASVVHLGDIATPIAKNRIETQVSESYKGIFNKVFQTMNEHVDDGSSPEKVAIFVENLLKKKRLKGHYLYGKSMQKLSITLKKMLPYSWFEGLIKKYSNL